ncbi:hypothetical protein LCGC14_0297960 [marine sediment metagenome]|uniref:Uncharacterized protein n=1 Tax=marine sediment metagenome TaxID=412755 RepID=A0A0F9U873_9ZZZZ
MSKKGIQIAADIFAGMQQARYELFELGTQEHDNRDILLAQMLEKGKDAMKWDFCKITTKETP